MPTLAERGIRATPPDAGIARPLTVTWSDELTYQTRERLREMLHVVIARTPRDVLVDLTGCPHLTLDGEAVLLACCRLRRQTGFRFSVRVQPGSQPEAQLRTNGVLAYLTGTDCGH